MKQLTAFWFVFGAVRLFTVERKGRKPARIQLSYEAYREVMSAPEAREWVRCDFHGVTFDGIPVEVRENAAPALLDYERSEWVEM